MKYEKENRICHLQAIHDNFIWVLGARQILIDDVASLMCAKAHMALFQTNLYN